MKLDQTQFFVILCKAWNYINMLQAFGWKTAQHSNNAWVCEGVFFPAQLHIKQNPWRPLWDTDLWVWRLFGGQSCTAVCDTMRQDFTTVENNHSCNYFVFCHSVLKVIRRNTMWQTVLQSYQDCVLVHSWLATASRQKSSRSCFAIQPCVLLLEPSAWQITEPPLRSHPDK